VAPGVAGISFYCEFVVLFPCGVVVEVDERRILMIVGGWPVVMVRMIVPEVLVYVQRRAHGA
jgi:hypothetical protein